jgi:hypothetical protein
VDKSFFSSKNSRYVNGHKKLNEKNNESESNV